MRTLTNVIIVGSVIISLAFLLYGSWWIGKRASYLLLYEDMVQATVAEMVKPDCLKDPKTNERRSK